MQTTNSALSPREPSSSCDPAGVNAFVDEWTAQSAIYLRASAECFRAFQHNLGCPQRSWREAALEMLVLGAQLRLYSRQPEHKGPLPVTASRAVQDLTHWLRVQSHRAQAARFEEWRAFLENLPQGEAWTILAECLEAAARFAADSQRAWGAADHRQNDFPGSAYVIRQEQALEDHLGRLAIEVLNRAYLPAYLQTTRRMVLLPESASQDGQHCAAHLYQACPRGVYQTPEDARNCDLGPAGQSSRVGVVSALRSPACWEIGWLMNAAGVPWQGVLLAEGCRLYERPEWLRLAFNDQAGTAVAHTED